jgi:hypothetical protein
MFAYEGGSDYLTTDATGLRVYHCAALPPQAVSSGSNKV